MYFIFEIIWLFEYNRLCVFSLYLINIIIILLKRNDVAHFNTSTCVNLMQILL